MNEQQRTSEPKVLLKGLGFPEGPRWHDDRLWFSDFTHRTLYRLDLDGQKEEVVQLEDTPSGLGFLPDGTPVVVSMHERRLLRLADGASGASEVSEVYADLTGLGGDFLNDMVVDSEGRAYVGTRTRQMRPSRVPLTPGWAVDTIVLVDPGGTGRVIADGLIAPNGTVISPDGSYLVVAETYAQRLTRFDRRADGSLHNRRIFAEVPGSFPDGICLDDDGAIWFGSPYTDEFLRVRDGGEVTDRIPLAGGVACMLGGADRSTLFLLGVDPEQLPVPDASPPTPSPAGSHMPTGTHLPTGAHMPTGGHIWTLEAPRPGAGWP
jgi:sugar lactone lactonase YvrE